MIESIALPTSIVNLCNNRIQFLIITIHIIVNCFKIIKIFVFKNQYFY